MIRTYRLLLTGCAASALLAAANLAVPDAAMGRAALARLPLRFEANQGQFDSSFRYAARTTAYSVALTANGASFLFPGSPRISLSLPGSNASPSITPEAPLAVRTDYMIGPRRNWRQGIASYSRVRYSAVYPGIDMVFYGNDAVLEYDFVLQAGADPHAIRLQFSGADNVAVTPEGDLVLHTSGGQMVQHKPAVYQQDANGARQRISCRYRLLASDLVSIELDRYDRSRSLTIDPTITYATLMGGGATETMAGMKIHNGLMYIVGSTAAGDWTQKTTDMAYNSGVDCFIEIIDISTPGNFTLKYFSYLGGSKDDYPLGMDVDVPGFIYLAGYTTSTDFPMQGNVLTGMVQGNLNLQAGDATFNAGFLAKVDPNAAGTGSSLVFSTYLNGTLGNDQAEDVAAGPNGIAYVIGTTKSADFPITANAYAASLYGPSDCFMAQIDTVNDILMYSSYFGSELDDDGKAIALGANGLVYYAGSTDGTEFPVAGLAYHQFTRGNYDVVLGAFDLTQSGVNTQVYGTYFGGSDIDQVNAMTLDAQGRMLLTGYTLSNDFPITTLTAVQSTNHGNGDVFLSLVDLTKPPGDFLVYSTYLGGEGGDVGYGVTSDSLGHLYVTGYTMSGDFPVTGNAPQPNWGGGVDMFIARINPSIAGLPALDYSTYIGLDNTIVGCCLAVGPDGSLYIGGYTEAYLPLLPTYTPLQSIYGGGSSDDFLLVLSSPGGNVTGVTTLQKESKSPRRERSGGGIIAVKQ
ncbi:MAG TPA: SBBP repeat-containing protein [Bryobacteraceae bacterium]|nr:SBBP repeat-containing protein [Bryobacteraceae bacterium]